MPKRRTKLEKDFEDDFMDELDAVLPDGFWIKGNSTMRQGIPDRLFLHGPNWALLEFKRDSKSAIQPNQDWYVEKFNEMSYSAIVTPENYREVIDEIQSAFRRRG